MFARVATYVQAAGRMRHRHDNFTMKLLRRVLDSKGTFITEMEVSPDAQRLEDEEFLVDTQDIVQRLKDEGRHEARQKDLLTIYRTRFGSVPRKVSAAVERTRDDAALARWVEIFVARSAAEIVAAVAAKKA